MSFAATAPHINTPSRPQQQAITPPVTEHSPKESESMGGGQAFLEDTIQLEGGPPAFGTADPSINTHPNHPPGAPHEDPAFETPSWQYANAYAYSGGPFCGRGGMGRHHGLGGGRGRGWGHHFAGHHPPPPFGPPMHVPPPHGPEHLLEPSGGTSPRARSANGEAGGPNFDAPHPPPPPHLRKHAPPSGGPGHHGPPHHGGRHRHHGRRHQGPGHHHPPHGPPHRRPPPFGPGHHRPPHHGPGHFGPPHHGHGHHGPPHHGPEPRPPFPDPHHWGPPPPPPPPPFGPPPPRFPSGMFYAPDHDCPVCKAEQEAASEAGGQERAQNESDSDSMEQDELKASESLAEAAEESTPYELHNFLAGAFPGFAGGPPQGHFAEPFHPRPGAPGFGYGHGGMESGAGGRGERGPSSSSYASADSFGGKRQEGMSLESSKRMRQTSPPRGMKD